MSQADRDLIHKVESLRDFHDGLWYGCIPLSAAIVPLVFFFADNEKKWAFLMLTLILVGTGTVILVKWSQHKKEVLDHQHLVLPKGITKLSEVAHVRGETTEQAAKCLQELINRGYFDNAYIDFANDLFVASTNSMTATKCPNCGASWTVTTGTVNKCPFCGSYIKEEEVEELPNQTASAPSISERIEELTKRTGDLFIKDKATGLSAADHKEVDNVSYNVDEMIKVIEWLQDEHKKAEIFGGDPAPEGKIAYCARMKNNSGISFREFSVDAKLTSKSFSVDNVTLSIKDWNAGQTGDLYFYSRFSPRDVYTLDIDVQSLRYSRK